MDLQAIIKDLNQVQRLDLLKFLQYEIEAPKFDYAAPQYSDNDLR